MFVVRSATCGFRPSTALVIVALMLAIGCGRALADPHQPCVEGEREVFPDGLFVDKPNDDKALLVMVAGLGGEGTWSRFTEALDCDVFFNRFDLLVYHTPKDLPLEKQVDRIAAILSDYRAYPEQMMVAHSMGGFVAKRYLLDLGSAADARREGLSMLWTYGTPLDTDKFGGFFLQRITRIVKALVSPLEQEIFDNDNLRSINHDWKRWLADAGGAGFRFVGVFGLDDDKAWASRETPSQNVVLIAGDHRTVMNDGCSFKILKAVLEHPATDPRSLDCARRISDRNRI